MKMQLAAHMSRNESQSSRLARESWAGVRALVPQWPRMGKLLDSGIWEKPQTEQICYELI